ncbi:efflux transporter outer membrane subunit [Paraburkholderia terricola]|uniref:NodT family efflux transporter outer membrane factor (OMF) lipoprotein n=1 Tax=Paraburkholderia terricola TaxID=169427 RepID=A0ABU1LJQ0_9BURK|nr:efflux transporter outer membrane subunit [Paraburkholderia terricola]MDR6406956.1 NodT family efflux transporter outer membrane factor (OMF) lipoprotein [Paraburkholderia terricola]MDR6479365.1 NodT family efflux transporter outer membrane factor (OMF) lipoprotein [Paraburkholderia terricola]
MRRALVCHICWRTLTALAVTASAALLAACTVGPDYQRPQADVPPAWQTDSYWRVGVPSHAPISPDWWQTFGDTTLDTLETQALAQNQTLAAASAHYEQAKATLATTRAQQTPEVDLNASASRFRISRSRPQTNYATPTMSTVQNNLQLGPSINYDTDLFGRIRRQVEGAAASAQQSADDLANARLVLTTDLATSYFSLRELDAEIDVLNQSVKLQQKALDYVTSQHDLGAVSGLDVLQQKSLLDSTRVQAQLLLNQRAQFEHAIAALVGVPAPQFSIAPRALDAKLPAIALGVPSDVLQRRPDVASAERAMAAANAQIGVAKAAFFPSLTLTPSIGWESTQFASLLSAPTLMWTLGAAAGQVLFDGGRRAANVQFASEGYKATQATYRQTVLNAFQQVQDGITGLSVLDGAAKESHAAVADAQHLLALANDRYSGGLVAYLDVITAQQSLLNSERQDVQIRGQQMTLAVSLVKALGGGWDAGADVAGLSSPKDATRQDSKQQDSKQADSKQALAPAR